MLGATAAMRRFAQTAGRRYAEFSTKRPYVCSTLTACGILGWADITAQQLFNRDMAGASFQERLEKHDVQRTLALTSWGTLHYGLAQKSWYLTLDRFIGTGGAFRKMILDVYWWTPSVLIPGFYLGTGLLKKHPYVQVRDPDPSDIVAQAKMEDTSVMSILREEVEHLKRDWVEASFGSAMFWTPIVYTNMAYVPQHSRIATIVWASFMHKTWLSWLSHREVENDAAADDKKPFVIETAQEALEEAVEINRMALGMTFEENKQEKHKQADKRANTIADSLGVTSTHLNTIGYSLVGGGFYLATSGGGRRFLAKPWRYIGPTSHTRRPALAQELQRKSFTETHPIPPVVNYNTYQYLSYARAV